MEHHYYSFNAGVLSDFLQPICRQPLTGMWRAAGQVFEFGQQRPDTKRKGEPISRGNFLLKFVSADWRVIHRDRVILGSSDYCYEDIFYECDELYPLPYNTEARRLAKGFFKAVEDASLIVAAVNVGPFADVTVELLDGLTIESFASSGQDHDVLWCHDLRSDVSCLVGPAGVSQGSVQAPAPPEPES